MKDQFLPLVSKEKTKTYQNLKSRVANNPHLEISQSIALRVLDKLDELGWSQKELAIKMGVSPQQVSKIVRGSENLTLESLVKLESALGLEILLNH
jgi:ribosome-binding protein aMBF1 (putative translation factor)